MSANCCHEDDVFRGGSPAYRRALLAVIAINGIMFLVEASAGFAAASQALKADALDFLADTLTYALSLWAISQSARVRALTALFKGTSLAVMGAGVFALTAYRVIVQSSPDGETMGIVGGAALIANVVSALILMRFKDGDANVRSVWMCSRNDAIGNVAVICAAGLVAWTGSAYPDLLVAAAMAGLFLHSSISIIRQARQELRTVPA